MMFPQHINTPVGSYAFVCTTTNKFTGGFEFHMFNTQTHVTYKEKLKPQAFMERLMEVNANDQFNEYAVRKALVVGKATYSDMVLREIGGIEVITLKYEIDGSPMPLEWKWKVDFDHMGPLFNNGVVATAGMYKEILGQIDYLLDVIKSKDEELEQFRGNSVLSGISNPFNVKHFEDENEQAKATAASLAMLAKIIHTQVLFGADCDRIPTAEQEEESAHLAFAYQEYEPPQARPEEASEGTSDEESDEASESE